MDKQRDITVIARKVLADLFEDRAWVQGLLSGKKERGLDGENPFKGTNITFGMGKQIVSVCRGTKGRLRVHPLLKVEDHLLSKVVKRRLTKAGLEFE